MKMVSQAEEHPKLEPGPAMATEKGATFPTVAFRNLNGLQGKKPGDECLIMCRVKVLSHTIGKEYGDGAGKDKTVTSRVSILEAGTKPYSPPDHNEYAKQGHEAREKKVRDIIANSQDEDD
jgi:hypothetical protein